MQTSVNERIKLIIETLFNGNISSFSNAIDVKRTTINSIIGEKQTAPGYNIIRNIGEISSPKINLDWLILGIGEMYSSGENNISISQTNSNNSQINESEVIIRLLAQLEEKDRQLREKDKQIETLLNSLTK